MGGEDQPPSAGSGCTTTPPLTRLAVVASIPLRWWRPEDRLVIIPKQSMWTLMIWLFQLQSWSHPSVTYASLVVAAIPTMLIFLFCQKLMMRGIIVPSEK